MILFRENFTPLGQNIYIHACFISLIHLPCSWHRVNFCAEFSSRGASLFMCLWLRSVVFNVSMLQKQAHSFLHLIEKHVCTIYLLQWVKFALYENSRVSQSMTSWTTQNFPRNTKWTFVKLCLLGKKDMTPNIKPYFAQHVAYMSPPLRIALCAAHVSMMPTCILWVWLCFFFS